jgi:UDP-N-acetylmuramate--L-alanine ligase/UDP-N-acetylenolpyruvoylglucosamine reductase
MNSKALRYHFVGIGGIGMSAIAQMLSKLGCTVSGSDIRATHLTRELEKMGIHVNYGHAAANLDGSDVVVYSSSIDEANPELKEARERGLTVWHRSRMLAELSRDKWTAAVSGAHGKSTTTSLLGWVYDRCGRKPTVVVGAKVQQLGGNFVLGAGPNMILEADESDASFLQYNPDTIIVTNIDADHLDYFRDVEDIYDKFRAFLGRMKPGGRWYGCADNAYVRRLLAECPRGAVSYGTGADCDFAAEGIELLGGEGSRFALRARGRELGEVRLGIFGRHNVLNATAVIALALDQGLDFDAVRAAVREYRGAVRRFDIAMNTDDLILIDDYAHHPTEIAATLEAARGFSRRRLLVVFQPHRYSRTQLLEEGFASCFDLADELVVTDVYAAGERPIEGVSGQALAARIARQRSKPTSFLPKDALLEGILARIRQGDMVMMMGAGDIGEVVHDVKRSASRQFEIASGELVKRLQEQCAGRLKIREPLKPHTSIKIGGPAECWFEPEDAQSLARALKIAKGLGTPVHVLGGGSNLLIADEGLEGLVVHLGAPAFKQLEMRDDEVVAGGGAALSAFLQFLIAHDRGECEFLMGVPAQVGGAVMMNAGSAQAWIGSYLTRLEAVTFDGELRELGREEIPFTYRSSGLKDLVIVRAAFRFPHVPGARTQQNIAEYAEYRKKTQDLRHANAGCMFRNPAGAGKSAGQLIDEAGLKGTRVGHAQISDIHGNFVVNLGGARQRDVLELIRLAEETVDQKYNVRLEREIKVLP